MDTANLIIASGSLISTVIIALSCIRKIKTKYCTITTRNISAGGLESPTIPHRTITVQEPTNRTHRAVPIAYWND